MSIPKQYVFKGEPVEKIWCVNRTPKNASKFCNKNQIMTSLLSINKNSNIERGHYILQKLLFKSHHLPPPHEYYISLNFTVSDAQEANYDSVFVSPFGLDSNNCGTEARPCQTITKAVRQVSWGGNIYLNGSGTENVIYNCGQSNEQPDLNIKKSLNIIGFLLPLVYCEGGFHFQEDNDERRIQVKLSGIVFKRTSLSFEDCQRVTIDNCTFRDGSEVLNVYLQNVSTFQLDITGYSLFQNNSLCLMLLFQENVRNKSRFVTVNINNTNFIRNGYHFESPFHRGGLQILSKERNAIKMEHINISCNGVKFVHNTGFFIDLYVPNVLTNETYKDLNLTFNKSPRYTNTLYYSIAKKPHVKFIALQCSSNPSSRCIKIRSDKAEVDIQGSLFNNIFQALYLDSRICASLRIFRSRFITINAASDGSLFATSSRGFLRINITSVLFRTCKAKKYGCVIVIGKPKEGHGRRHNESIPDELYFTLRDVTIEQWAGRNSKCSAVYILHKGGTVTIEDSRFYKKRLTSVDGALNVKTIGGKSNITVSNCSFIDKCVYKRRAIAFQIVASNGNAGSVVISNSRFISSGKKQKALLLSPKYRMRLVNITVISFRSGFQVLSSPARNDTFPIDIYVDKCTFVNNIFDMLLTLLDRTSVYVSIQNTIFISTETIFRKSYAIRLNIPPLKNISSTIAVIKLDNDTFNSKPSSNFALFFKGKKSVTIKGCMFSNCWYAFSDAQRWTIQKTDDFYETGSGAISILTFPDRALNSGCLHSNTIDDTHPLWQYESHVIFEDTVFKQNVGLISGGVHISNGFTTFIRCVFQDNFGIQQSGHIYSAYGTGRVDLEDCLFSRTKEKTLISNVSYDNAIFTYSESGGPLRVKNTSFTSVVPARSNFRMFDISSGGYVYVDDKTTMKCSKGSKLLFENATHIIYTEEKSVSCRINVTVLKYSCVSCPQGYYSLQKGTSRGLFVNSTVECLQCPFGASCIERNIAAKPNFWGYQARNSRQQQLQFSPCPEHYCKSPSQDSKESRENELDHSLLKECNSCHGKRNGTLCGKCAKGFTESLFSTECSKTTECNSYWIWVMMMLLSFRLVLYLLIRSPILNFLVHQSFWYRRDNAHQVRQHEDSDSGYIKIIFYFYQVAGLQIDTAMKRQLKKLPFFAFVISSINFQVSTVNNIGCPFPGLTAVTKELLLSGTVLLTMANVFTVFFVHLFINTLRQKDKPKLIHYMAVFMEVLLLGYVRLAEMSLKLMHCVSVGSKNRLFIDGNVPCLQWWQYTLLGYIAVFVLPFTLVLYWGSSKLYTSSVKAGEFLAACVFPLPFLIYWLYRRIRDRGGENESGSNQEVDKDVSKILYGPFRPPDSANKGTLYWESVLIGRRLILVALHTFITDAMLRGICMTSACFMMTIHHLLKNPYKVPLANKAETLSLAVLTLITAINLPKATLFSFGIEKSTDSLEKIKWIKVGALAFIPAMVCLLVIIALLSQLTRLGVVLFKYIRRLCQYRASNLTVDESTPLLDTSD